jgi:hypothetical protein
MLAKKIDTGNSVATIDVAALTRLRDAVDAMEAPADLKNLRDLTAKIEHGLRLRGDSRTMENLAAEAKLRAERKLGKILSGLDLDRGGRPKAKTNNAPPSLRLADFGVTPMQSSRWQVMARLTDGEFDSWCAGRKARDLELTTDGLYQEAKALHPRNPRTGQAPPATGGSEATVVDTSFPPIVHHCTECGAAFACDGGAL